MSWLCSLRRSVVFVIRERLSADDRVFCRESNRHRSRCKCHVELDNLRGDEPYHHARDIFIHICYRVDERESKCNDDLYSDRDEQFRFRYGDGHGHGELG